MSSSSTGRRTAADSRTARAAASALTPSWALTGSGVSSSDAAAEGFELGPQRLRLGEREAHRGSLAVAAQHRETVPLQRRGRRLDEPDVLGDVARPQQPVLADQGDLALLLGGQPVDVEQAERSPRLAAEADQAGQQVLLGAVQEAAAVGVDLADRAAEDVLHDVEVVGGEVDRDAGVLDPRRQRPDPGRVGPVDVAEAAFGDQLAQLRDRGVEALDVADHQLAVGLQRGAAHPQRVRQRRRDRLLDQHVQAGGERLERDFGVVLGGAGDRDRVQLARRRTRSSRASRRTRRRACRRGARRRDSSSGSATATSWAHSSCA